MSRRGLYEWATVVAVTSFIAPSAWPRQPEDQTVVLLDELNASIDQLNRYIVSLGLVRRDATIFPIALGDLPALCPCIIETIPMPTGQRIGTSFAYPIHDVTPNLSRAEPDEGSAYDAAFLARLDFHGQQPFFLFLELMQRAGAAWIRQRSAQEIVDIGTAMEVLFSTIIREASSALNEPETRREGILMAPLRSQVQDHLGRYANITVDLDDEADPAARWWNNGYALRNRVVHEGHWPTAGENAEAREAANELIGALRSGLLSSEPTRELGEALAWGEVSDET